MSPSVELLADNVDNVDSVLSTDELVAVELEDCVVTSDNVVGGVFSVELVEAIVSVVVIVVAVDSGVVTVEVVSSVVVITVEVDASVVDKVEPIPDRTIQEIGLNSPYQNRYQ